MVALSQSGVYGRGTRSSDSTIVQWTLKLNPDGTFLYHFLRDLSGKANKEENYYGKGIWQSEGKIVSFYSEASDFDTIHTVNLNNSKARYIEKSPRDTSDKIVKTAIHFYQSETSYIKGLKLLKNKI